MDGAELEEFVQMLRMSQAGNAAPGAQVGTGRVGGAQRPKSFWSSFAGKASVSAAVFVSAIVLFRTYGHTLA